MCGPTWAQAGPFGSPRGCPRRWLSRPHQAARQRLESGHVVTGAPSALPLGKPLTDHTASHYKSNDKPEKASCDHVGSVCSAMALSIPIATNIPHAGAKSQHQPFECQASSATKVFAPQGSQLSCAGELTCGNFIRPPIC
jgi:hypothetical protein